MKVRRKSLWRSQNNKLAIKRRNQRAAKERKRAARAGRAEVMPALAHAARVKPARPLFVVTIRCRDGASVKLRVHEVPWGLSVAPTLAGRKVASVLRHYRPAAHHGLTG